MLSAGPSWPWMPRNDLSASRSIFLKCLSCAFFQASTSFHLRSMFERWFPPPLAKTDSVVKKKHKIARIVIIPFTVFSLFQMKASFCFSESRILLDQLSELPRHSNIWERSCDNSRPDVCWYFWFETLGFAAHKKILLVVQIRSSPRCTTKKAPVLASAATQSRFMHDQCLSVRLDFESCKLYGFLVFQSLQMRNLRDYRTSPKSAHHTEQRQAAIWWDQIRRETVRMDSSAGLLAGARLRAQSPREKA